MAFTRGELGWQQNGVTPRRPGAAVPVPELAFMATHLRSRTKSGRTGSVYCGGLQLALSVLPALAAAAACSLHRHLPRQTLIFSVTVTQ